MENTVNDEGGKPDVDIVDAGPSREGFSTEDSHLKSVWYDDIFVLYCILLYIADIITDILVSVKYFRNGDYVWFSLTLSCVLGASLVMMGFSLSWFYDDTAPEVSKTKIIVIHLLQLGPLKRYWDVYQNGRKSRSTNSEPIYYKMYIEQWRDIAMLRLFETFLESAPQLVLQLYILAYNRHFDKDKDWLTAFAACISLISLSTSLVSYSKALRDASPKKDTMSWWAFGCQLCWRLTMVASRVTVLVLFASVYKYWILFVIGLHWFFMTIWLIYIGTSFPLDKTFKRLFYAIIGFIYLFCYFNIKDGTTRGRLVIFYSVIFVEDAILMGCWFPYKHEYGVVFVAAVVMVCGGFFLGLIAMLLYYQCYHPTLSVQGICARMRGCLCCEECFSKVSEEDPYQGSRLHVDIPVSRGSVGKSVSQNRNRHASPTFETELLHHHPSELQRQYSLDKHRKKKGKENAQGLHELENGVAKGTSLGHGVKNGSSLGHGVENSKTGEHRNDIQRSGDKAIAIDIPVCRIRECPEIHGGNPSRQSCRLKSKNKCDDGLHCGTDDEQETGKSVMESKKESDGLHCGVDHNRSRTGTGKFKSKMPCDDGLHCGTDDEQETGKSVMESKKESDGLHCGVDHNRSRTGTGKFKSKMPCDDGLHCGTDDEQETGSSASKRTSGGLHCGTSDEQGTGSSASKGTSGGLHCGTCDVEESTKGEHKLKLCEIQNPKYSLNVNFHNRYSIVSDCISLSSSSSDSDEASKEVTNPRNPQCSDEFGAELNTEEDLRDDNGNLKTTLLAHEENAQSSSALHSTAQRLFRKSKQANRVSFPNFVATSLKRGRFSSLRASNETVAEEMKTKRHTVDLSDLECGAEPEQNYTKFIQRFKPTQFGSVREQLEELKDSSEGKIK